MLIFCIPTEAIITSTQQNLANLLIFIEFGITTYNTIELTRNWEIPFFTVVFGNYSISFYSRGSTLKLILPRINDFLLIATKSCFVNFFSYSFRGIVNLSLFLGKSQRNLCRRSNLEFCAIRKLIGVSTLRAFNHKHHVASFLHCGKRSVLPCFCLASIILIRERACSNRGMISSIGIIPFFS